VIVQPFRALEGDSIDTRIRAAYLVCCTAHAPMRLPVAIAMVAMCMLSGRWQIHCRIVLSGLLPHGTIVALAVTAMLCGRCGWVWR
jgi:hypothetical protein